MTPDGVLFEREVILENLVAQKKDIARKLAQYEAQAAEDVLAAEQRAREAEQARVDAFHRLNHGGGGDAVGGAGAGGDGRGANSKAATSFQTDQARELKAFWVPSKTPEAATRAEKPCTDMLCPATGKRLRLKDLVPVKFTPLPAQQGKEDDDGRFMCPLCKETFTNVSRIVVLKPTGDAVGEECYKRFIEPDGAHARHSCAASRAARDASARGAVQARTTARRCGRRTSSAWSAVAPALWQPPKSRRRRIRSSASAPVRVARLSAAARA